MKYPYIGKAGRYEVLFTSKDSGFDFDNFTFHINGFNECQFKNITREYLANTYGKVESKEHAEFIVKLAENHDIDPVNEWVEGFWFNFFTNCKGEPILGFFMECTASDNGEKQITIPMPPKFDEQLNNGDNLMFGGEDKCEEWPAEGADFQNKHSKEKGVILAVYDDYVWCKYPGIHPMTLGIDRIQKPKTPEEELRDELTAIWSDEPDRESIINALIAKYNITKKPQ